MAFMLKNTIKRIINVFRGNSLDKSLRDYKKRFDKYAFRDCECRYYEQFEASIIRLYHTIEKGLSYDNYRPGFGKDNVEKLIKSLEQYIDQGFDTNSFVYRTALSCLAEYEKKNKEYGYIDEIVNDRIHKLPGKPNGLGGTIEVSKPSNTETINYETLIKERHSIRHFSNQGVEIEKIKEAIQLAQYTPSACNRQGWKTRIIADKQTIEMILANQNGNRGFGQEIDKLLLVTADLRAQQKNREFFQAYIDGGMYAQSILNALFYKGIGSIPLSGSLTHNQEKNVRKILNIDDAEVIILFIGVGNYPEETFLTTRSERKSGDCLY